MSIPADPESVPETHGRSCTSLSSRYHCFSTLVLAFFTASVSRCSIQLCSSLFSCCSSTKRSRKIGQRPRLVCRRSDQADAARAGTRGRERVSPPATTFTGPRRGPRRRGYRPTPERRTTETTAILSLTEQAPETTDPATRYDAVSFASDGGRMRSFGQG